MKAQTYSVLITIEDSNPPSASSLASMLKKMLENDAEYLAYIDAVYGSSMPPPLVKRHNAIHQEYK